MLRYQKMRLLLQLFWHQLPWGQIRWTYSSSHRMLTYIYIYVFIHISAELDFCPTVLIAQRVLTVETGTLWFKWSLNCWRWQQLGHPPLLRPVRKLLFCCGYRTLNGRLYIGGDRFQKSQPCQKSFSGMSIVSRRQRHNRGVMVGKDDGAGWRHEGIKGLGVVAVYCLCVLNVNMSI